MFICFLKRSENSLFLFLVSSSPLPPSLSSHLLGETTESSRRGRITSTFQRVQRELVLPFEAVASVPSFVRARLEPKWARGLGALSCLGPEAVRGRSVQLVSDKAGVPAEVAGAGAVRRHVPEKLGDGGVATTDERIKTKTHSFNNLALTLFKSLCHIETIRLFTCRETVKQYQDPDVVMK